MELTNTSFAHAALKTLSHAMPLPLLCSRTAHAEIQPIRDGIALVLDLTTVSSVNSHSIETNADAMKQRENASAASLSPNLTLKSQSSPARHQNRDKDALALTLPTTSHALA